MRSEVSMFEHVIGKTIGYNITYYVAEVVWVPNKTLFWVTDQYVRFARLSDIESDTNDVPYALGGIASLAKVLYIASATPK